MKSVLLPIEGMTCSSCVARVKKELLALDGVAEVSVDLVERQARVRFDGEKLSKDRLVTAVDGLGYRAGVPKDIE